MKDHHPERPGRFASLTWYGQSGFRLAAGDGRVLIDPFLTDRADRRYRPPAAAPDFADITLVLCTHEHVDHLDLPFLREFCAVIPINGRDYMRESGGMVGNMNETEATWLCAQVSPAFVIPMHYEAIASNTGDPGHFTTLVRESGAPTAVLVPPRAVPVTLALP
jgi:L-ascorbate metabolism protein UlaG (beta-lactamase superfamily)